MGESLRTALNKNFNLGRVDTSSLSRTSSGWKKETKFYDSPRSLSSAESIHLLSVPKTFDANKAPKRELEAQEKRAAGSTGPEGHKWKSGRPHKYPLEVQGCEDPFEECGNISKNTDTDMCHVWEEEMDSLLVFAGLFSAVVTAFCVESFQWLMEEPDDASVKLLAQIAANMQTLANPNTTSPGDQDIDFSPDASEVRVNIFWFLSLTLSLSAALISILAKQWLRAYQRDFRPFDLDKASFAMRQSRYDGLHAWKVPHIISAIPLLLQLSLALFFIGVIDLMWSLNQAVAIAVAVSAGSALLFLLVTTLLPAIMWIYSAFRLDLDMDLPSQCPYKSPLAWSLVRLCIKFVHFFDGSLKSQEEKSLIEMMLSRYDWALYDQLYRHDIASGRLLRDALLWIFPIVPDGVLCRCLRALPLGISGPILERLFDEFRVKEREQGTVDLELLDPFIPFAKQEYENGNHQVAKDIVATCYLLGPSYDPNDENIPYCLENCIRIINATTAQLPEEIVPLLESILKLMADPLPDDIAVQLSIALKTALDDDHITVENVAYLGDILWKLHIWATKRGHVQPKHALRPFSALADWLNRWMETEETLYAKSRLLRESVRVLEAIGLLKSVEEGQDVAEVTHTPEIQVFVRAVNEQFDAFRDDEAASTIHLEARKSLMLREYLTSGSESTTP